MPRRRENADTTENPISRAASLSSDSLSCLTRAVASTLLAGAMLVPVVISVSGDDHFRLPKQLVMYAVAIVTIALTGIALLYRNFEVPRPTRRLFMLASAGLTWGAIAALLSDNRWLSLEAMIWATMLTSVLLIGAIVLSNVSPSAVAVATLVPAVVNAVVVALQASRLWNPWLFEKNTHGRITRNALLGNPDDLGVYLAIATLYATVMTMYGKRRWRFAYGVIATILALALLATQTLTAMLGFTAAFLVLAFRWRPRAGAALSLAVALALGAVSYTYVPMRARLQAVGTAASRGEWGAALSGRLIPFATAWDMFKTHPFAGVGPGGFKFHYMPTVVAVETELPRLAVISRTQRVNFAETHNDHLQVLAETGFPGYLLLISGILFIAAISFERRTDDDDPRHGIARGLALPLAVLLFVMMGAQFVLQLAAPAYTSVLLAAACVAWRRADAA